MPEGVTVPLVYYPSLIVSDPVTKEPRPDLFGTPVTLVDPATGDPLTGLVEPGSGAAVSNPVTVSPTGYVPSTAKEDGPPMVLAVSGDWTTEIWSPSGAIEFQAATRVAVEEARDAAVAAQGLAEEAVEGDVYDLVPGVGVEFVPDDVAKTTTVNVTVTGGTGGTTTVDGLTDAGTVGKAVVKADTSAEARATIGAGRSEVTVGGAYTGVAAPAATAVTTTGTGTQTVSRATAFTSPVTLPAESVPQDRVIGLPGSLSSLDARRKLIVKQNQDDPLPADWRPGDIVVYLTPSTGGTEEPPPTDTTALKRLFLAGITDNTALTTAGGTDDTPLDAVSSPAPLVQTVDGRNRIHIPTGTQAYTWRWTTGLPTGGVFTMDYTLDVLAAPSAATTILIAGGVFSLSMNTGRQITVLNSAGSPALASVGGVVGGESPALTTAGTYHVKAFRATDTAGTLTKFRMYDPTGVLVWDVNRDVGVANPTSFIMGRTGTTSGEFLHGPIRLDDSGTELAHA